MFCSNCGKELAEGTKFCSSCGASLTVVSEEAQQEALRLEEERQRKIKEAEEKRLKEIEKAKEKIKAIEDYNAVIESNDKKFGNKGFKLICLLVTLVSLIFILPVIMGDYFLPDDSFLITKESAIIGLVLLFISYVGAQTMYTLSVTQNAKYAKTVSFTVKDFYDYHKTSKNVLRDMKLRTGIVALSIKEDKYKKMFIKYLIGLYYTTCVDLVLAVGAIMCLRLGLITYKEMIITFVVTTIPGLVLTCIGKEVAKQKVKELETGN